MISRRRGFARAVIGVGLVQLLLVGLSASARHGNTRSHLIQTGDPVAGAADTISLEQGWDVATQDEAWYLSFGSRLMPYDWFLHLPAAAGVGLFRADARMSGLGFLPQSATEHNPDGLPVGFSRDRDDDQVEWVGLTCAACHTGEVQFRGTRLRVAGGQGLLDFNAFEAGVIDALSATVADANRFDTFARAVLGTDADARTLTDLKTAVVERTQDLSARHRINATPVAYGHGRLDAFGQIFNTAAVELLGVPDNRRVPDAPVSFPVLWGAPHLDLVQWNGSAPNAQIGPLIQNTTTALAVYGQLEFRENAGPRGYASSVDFHNLARIQNFFYALKSPQWPQDVLGAIDEAQASRGGALYTEHCARCHERVDRDDLTRRQKATLVALDEIGTDPRMANNFLSRRTASGPLEGHRVAYVAGDRIEAQTSTINLVVHMAFGAVARHPVQVTAAAVESWHTVDSAAVDAHPSYYKARSLDGIWSSAPYLHNGSVPTLHDLLLPPAQRPARFYVGSRELDVERVGLDSRPGARRSLFDTHLPGNDNGGHLYGTGLSVADRAALVEYLKTL